MIIFNFIALGELLVTALIGAAIAGVMSVFGFDFTFWLLIVSFALAVPVDLLWRASQMFGDEETGESGNALAIITPGGGGHLFFIPMWILGLAMPFVFAYLG